MNHPNLSSQTSGEIRGRSISLSELFRVFLKIGLLSFGGPAAQIALMHRLIVEEQQWLDEKQYLNALNFCMLLPGPEAMQLATYAGWRLRGIAGGLVAGLLFVVPGALFILLLAFVYVWFGKLPLIDAVFLGVKSAVIIIVIEALIKVSRRSLKQPIEWAIAVIAFIAIFFLNLPYPFIVLAAAIIGFYKLRDSIAENANPGAQPIVSIASTAVLVLVFIVLWFSPLAILYLTNGHDFLIRITEFFSVLAVVTFGGAYAVLAYMAQDVVTGFGWLTAGEMMDGLGLAETTPGPLILVTEFVAFVAGFKQYGIATALSAAALALWVTFIPCFLWIFAGAPYIEWISNRSRLKGALTAITAAVVGVILNLSVWFALHVMFGTVNANKFGPLTFWTPEFSSLDSRVLVMTAVCGIAAFVLHFSIGKLLVLAAFLGLSTLFIA